MSNRVAEQEIRAIKRRAKQLSRVEKGKTYMQHLDDVARELRGVRHFHELKRLEVMNRATPATPSSPYRLYLKACQDAYFEL